MTGRISNIERRMSNIECRSGGCFVTSFLAMTGRISNVEQGILNIERRMSNIECRSGGCFVTSFLAMTGRISNAEQGMSNDEVQRMGDRRQIENKHEIRSTKYETNSNVRNTKFKK